MRILLLTHYYAPEIGAPQHRWDAFAERFVAAGHEVAVLAPAPHYPSGRAGALAPEHRPGAVARGRHGEMIHRLRFREYGTGVSGRGLDQAVAAADAVRIGLARFRGVHRPDVIVATVPGLPTIPAGLALGAALRVPVVLEMRDAWPDLLGAHEEWDTASVHAWQALVARTVPAAITAMQRRADAVVTTTDAFAEVLRGRGMRAVTTIRNGTALLDSDHSGVSPRDARLEAAGADRDLRVLYLGTIGRSQGLATAVRAAARARSAGVPVQVRIVGDGAEATAIARLAAELHAPVTVEAPVPREAAVRLYGWADTVLVSLRDWEPLRWTVPSKLYEVMASGRHVSAALPGVAADLVRAAGVGHVVPPGDVPALADLWGRLHHDRDLLDVGQRGKVWLQQHAALDVLAARYLDLLARLIGGPAPETRVGADRPTTAASDRHGLARLTELGRNTALLARTALHHAADDPLLLVVQTARRLPGRVRGPVAHIVTAGTSGPPTVRGAFGALVADHRDAAADLLVGVPAPRSRAGRRLAAELAVQLGRPDLIPGGLTSARAVTQARAAWQRGDVSGAITLAGGARGGARYRDRLISEQRTMEAGFRLQASSPRTAGSAPTPRGSWGAAHRGSGAPSPRALHVLTNSLPRTRSGYAIRSHAVLRAQQEAGIAVEVVTRIGYPVTVGLPQARTVDVVDGVTYRRILPTDLARTPEGRLQQMVDQVLRAAERFEPTVLHTTTNYTNALVTEAAARATGLPWVYEVRGLLEMTWLAALPEAERAAAEQSERYALLHAKETEMTLAADRVVTLSETLRDNLVARGIAPAQVSVIPNAVDGDLLDFVLDPADARTRLGLPPDGFWVGTVSSLVDYEGLDTLVEAVAMLRTRGLDVRAAIVGDGVSRPGLIAQAERLGLAPVVTFPGRVDRATATLWHRALDTFIVPRRDLPVCRVVTPLKPIEAMAAGRPVVASDLPALAEIVSGPGTGLVTPPGSVPDLADAIEQLLHDDTARARYGAAGRSFAAGRTWRANGVAYRDLYERTEATA